VAREHGTAVANGYEIHFPLTHEDLGFLVGAHRVSITRAMKHLKDTGRIIQAGQALVVTLLDGCRVLIGWRMQVSWFQNDLL
jgi:CRP/FNR family transcriptional regulator